MSILKLVLGPEEGDRPLRRGAVRGGGPPWLPARTPRAVMVALARELMERHGCSVTADEHADIHLVCFHPTRGITSFVFVGQGCGPPTERARAILDPSNRRGFGYGTRPLPIGPATWGALVAAVLPEEELNNHLKLDMLRAVTFERAKELTNG